MRTRGLFDAMLALALILLIFVMYAMVTTGGARTTIRWEASDNDSVYYMVDDNGTLYAFMASHVCAINGNGSIKWEVSVPGQWWVGSKYSKPAVAVDNGTLYVYLRPNVTMAAEEKGLAYQYDDFLTDVDDHNKRLMNAYAGTPFASSLDERLIAILPDGSVAWSLPLGSELYGVDVQARDGRIYVYHGYNETVLGENGSVIFTIGDVGAIPAVDENGSVYLVKTSGYVNGDNDRRPLSETVEAYGPDGSLRWQYDAGEGLYVQNIMGQASSLPLYDDHTLYLPLADGIIAMDAGGHLKWTKHYDETTRLFSLMPFDPDGNVYVRCFPSPGPLPYDPYPDSFAEINVDYLDEYRDVSYPGSSVSVLGADGNEVNTPASNGITYIAASDGIGYATGEVPGAINLTAYDLKSGVALWSHTFTAAGEKTVTVNASNVRYLLWPEDMVDAITRNRVSATSPTSQSSPGPVSAARNSDVRLLCGKDVTYVDYWAYSYEEPVTFGRSNCTYSGGIYAFDRSGKLLWSRPLDSLLSSMYEQNGTFYYSTGTGDISAASINVIEGLALLTALYILLRFVVIGAISRARDVIDKNDNRNAVLSFISGHPGSTMYEVSRALDMNKGTVRYHLLILGLNHRVTAKKSDRKFVRYFMNASSYDAGEQLIISIVRRDALRKVIEALLTRPGSSNAELARELGLPGSVMSRYMGELCEKGVVEKSIRSGVTIAYTIKNDYKGLIQDALKRMNSE